MRTWKVQPLQFLFTGNRISKPEKNKEKYTTLFFLSMIRLYPSSSPFENLWNMRLKVDSCLYRLTNIIYLYVLGFVCVFIVPLWIIVSSLRITLSIQFKLHTTKRQVLGGIRSLRRLGVFSQQSQLTGSKYLQEDPTVAKICSPKRPAHFRLLFLVYP